MLILMSIPSIVILVVLGIIVLTIALIVAWMLRKAVFINKFVPPTSIDGDNFKQLSYNNIPYIIENGVPYRGDIVSTGVKRVYLNEGFSFSLDNDDCTPLGISNDSITVNLPHCYNIENSPLRDYKGDVWYEREFDITLDDMRPNIRLTFMGSFNTTTVYIDGELIGVNEEGYLPFTFDITNLSLGRHKLIVKVNNITSTTTLPLTLFSGHRPGWHHYSGLHKDVFIEYLPPVSVFHLSCIPRFDGKWSIDISLLMESTTNKQLVDTKIRVVDRDNIEVLSYDKEIFISDSVNGYKVNLPIDNPMLWSEVDPYLYTLEVITEYEKASVTFGIRHISCDKSKILLNNRQIFLKGVCRHEDSGIKGMATDKDYIDKELKLIRELNGNFVRLAHYPHSTVTMDITDNTGMYVWSEVPFYQAGHAITHDTFGKDAGDVSIRSLKPRKIMNNIKKTSLAYDTNLIIIAARMLIKLVLRDINHPSVITWGVGNEIWSVSIAAGKALKWLKEKVREIDNSRPINYASMSMPVLTVPFEKSFKHMDWVCVNEYYGWYYGRAEQVKDFAKALSRKYPNKPLVITETGSDTLLGLRDNDNPPMDKHSEDYQAYYIKTQWECLNEAPTFSGISVWVLKDFPCPEYTEDNLIPYYNMKGIIDKDMNKKLSYYTLKELYSSKQSYTE